MTNYKIDIFYLQEALKSAELALKHGEVPIGALVVDGKGIIIGRGWNKIEEKKCQLAHAEALAIQAACKKLGTWRLDGCSLYVTLEPCLMCFGLIHLSRIKRLVYGARSPLFGFSLIVSDQNHRLISAYKSNIEVVGGLKESACVAMMQSFFQGVRKIKRSKRMKERGAFVENMRRELLKKRDELVKLLNEQSGGRLFEGQVRDTADEAFSLSMEKLQNSLEQSDIDEIKLINQALERIKNHEYGLCVDCKKPISDKRLEYYPYAARCIVCQEKYEEEQVPM